MYLSNFLKCLALIVAIISFSIKGMEKDKEDDLRSHDRPVWKKTTQKSSLSRIETVALSPDGHYAFLGSRSFAQLIALNKGSVAGEMPIDIGGLKNSVSAAFNPGRLEIAVATPVKVELLYFSDDGWNGINCINRSSLIDEGNFQEEFGPLESVTYNDDGLLIVTMQEWGKVIVWNSRKKEIFFSHSLGKPSFSVEFLPRATFPGDHLLVGELGSRTFCYTTYNDRTEFNGRDAGRECLTCFDKRTGRIIESRFSKDDFSVFKIDPKNLTHAEFCGDFARSEFGLCMNIAEHEVLLSQQTDSRTLITDINHNPLATFPKELAIKYALLSADGQRLLTMRDGGNVVHFWHKS